MIEIIREENWDDTKEKKLPKDIRQIGRPDVVLLDTFILFAGLCRKAGKDRADK